MSILLQGCELDLKMKTLWLLRHAKSSWSDATLDDHERPLNKRGKEAALAVGKFIKQAKLRPDLVLCSTAVRVRETVEIIADVAGLTAKVEYHHSLYLSDRSRLIEHISSVSEHISSVSEPLNAMMVVGHNPGMEELLRYLVGVEKRFPTAALAEISMNVESWQQFKKPNIGKLQRLIYPRDLEK